MPVKRLQLAEGETLVASVYDLFLANYSVDRGFGGENVAKSYDDDVPYTPAWAEKVTGVKRHDIALVAREFADNAAKTNGKSMVILGAGINHWYHMDMIYRGIISMLTMCGCVGQSGGGWAHYVGQEKLRPQPGWTALAFALDWGRPPRQMNSTSFWYAHTDQWRYEKLNVSEIISPTAEAGDWSGSLIDFNVRVRAHGLAALGAAARNQSADGSPAMAEKAGKPAPQFVAEGLKSGALKLSCEDPDAPQNFPRNLFVWRSNLLGLVAARATNIS